MDRKLNNFLTLVGLCILDVSKYLNNVGDTLARKLDRKMQEHNHALGKYFENIFNTCVNNCNAVDANSQDDEADTTNRIVQTTKDSTLVPDLPPVTIRQEPTSPVKVRHLNNFCL